jgi:hypothetical protein
VCPVYNICTWKWNYNPFLKRCGFYTRNGTMYVSHSVTPPITVRNQVRNRLLWNHVSSPTSRNSAVWICFGRAVSKLFSSLLPLWWHLSFSPNCTVQVLHTKYCMQQSSPQFTLAQAQIYGTYSWPGCHCCLEICHHGFNSTSGYRISYILLGHPLE